MVIIIFLHDSMERYHGNEIETIIHYNCSLKGQVRMYLTGWVCTYLYYRGDQRGISQPDRLGAQSVSSITKTSFHKPVISVFTDLYNIKFKVK